MSKIILFDIWGDYAHFRKPYTTTSPLTYAFPPRTAITGIIGAILGLEKEKNNQALDSSQCNIAIKMLHPLKKTIISENFIDTKRAVLMSRIKGRTQIRIEFLKDVRYRIYIGIFNNEMHNKLKKMLQAHTSIFTVSLGISESIANFRFIGEYQYAKKQGDADIDSVIVMDEIKKESIKLEEEKEYFTDRFPMDMKENREVSRYSDILFERKCRKIKVRNCSYITVENNENIIWL